MRLKTLWEARWILAILLGLTLLSLLLSPWLAGLWVVFILYTFYFFRDPERVSPSDPRVVVAAADGVVADIVEIVESEVVKERMKRVAIFLSVFNVHTNRAPVAGKVVYSQHHPGKFLDARNPEASTKNEYHTWGFENPAATLVARQITGAIARRIVAWSQVGDELKKGERFGMIRFGSRTEVYLPMDAEVLVKVGDKVKGGETIIAKLSETV